MLKRILRCQHPSKLYLLSPPKELLINRIWNLAPCQAGRDKSTFLSVTVCCWELQLQFPTYSTHVQTYSTKYSVSCTSWSSISITQVSAEEEDPPHCPHTFKVALNDSEYLHCIYFAVCHGVNFSVISQETEVNIFPDMINISTKSELFKCLNQPLHKTTVTIVFMYSLCPYKSCLSKT